MSTYQLRMARIRAVVGACVGSNAAALPILICLFFPHLLSLLPQVYEAAEIGHIHQHIMHFPHGYATRVGGFAWTVWTAPRLPWPPALCTEPTALSCMRSIINANVHTHPLPFSLLPVSTPSYPPTHTHHTQASVACACLVVRSSALRLPGLC